MKNARANLQPTTFDLIQVNNKLKTILETWDLKSLLFIILIFGIAISSYFYFTGRTDKFRTEKAKEFAGRTTAEIISIEPMDVIHHGRRGTRIEIENYKVCYRYRVIDKDYKLVDYIPNTSKNKELINKLLNKRQLRFTVKFDPADPEKSLLTND